MRISIGAKIFAMALLLLALMAGISLFSSLKMDAVADEMEVLAGIYLPLLEDVTDVEKAVLEQEIELGRLRLLYDSPNRDSPTIEAAQEAFGRYSRQVDGHLEHAAALLAQARGRVYTSEGAGELGEITVRLELVRREQADFEDHAQRLLAAKAAGNTAVRDAFAEIIDPEEAEFDRAVDELRRQVAMFSQRSSIETRGEERRLRTLSGLTTALATVIGLMFAGLIALGLVRPIRAVLAGMERIRGGDLDAHIEVGTRDETRMLARGFNAMADELKIKQRIKDTFGQYVDPRIVEDLIRDPRLAAPGGERRDMTVFFSDIAGFTQIGERLTPTALVSMINAYLTELSHPIQEQDGVVDKFIGDAIMAYWGPPFVAPDEQAAKACRAALASLELVGEFSRRVPELIGIRDKELAIDIRIGIATGSCVVGNIGSDVRQNYTLMGDTVNLGSRLEGACKVYGIRVLIDEETRIRAGGAVEVREIDKLVVKGKDEPVRVFQPLALGGRLDEAGQRLKQRFEEALSAWRAGDWAAAEAGFRQCLELAPDDGPSRTFLSRLDQIRAAPPQDWDGVWRLQTK